MNKWFDKNLANYAKSALLEAQKRIDQVLDIKEDEITAKFKLDNPTSVVDNKAPSDSELTKNKSQTDLHKQQNNLEASASL
jgi:hypothetical protein